MTGRGGKEMRLPNLKSQPIPLRVNYLQSFDGVHCPEWQLDVEEIDGEVFGIRRIS